MPIVCVASKKFEYLKPRHVRAARALLDWTQDDLAKVASVVRRTVVAVETGSVRCQPRKIEAMLMAFKAAGVDFVFEADGVVSLVDSSLHPEPSVGSKTARLEGEASGHRIATSRGKSLLTTRVSGRRRTGV